MYIYIYKSQISLPTIISSHCLRLTIYLFSPSTLAFHYITACEIISRIMPVTKGDFLYMFISYAIWVYRSRESHLKKHTSNIVNWYENRSSKTLLSDILWFEHGGRLNSSVSYHASNRKFGRMQRWFCQYLSHMQYEHEWIEISISIHEFQT